MNLLKIVSISLLAIAMAACGGGGSGPNGTTEDVEITEISEEIEDEVTVGTANIGRGSGTAFISGELQLDLSTISSGGTSNISASVVDITKNNQFIDTVSYAVAFNSTCADKIPAKATFSAENNTVITSTGIADVAYTATGCKGIDLITATLYRSDAPSTVLARAEAEVTVETAMFGGIAFVSNSETALSFTGIANSVLKSSNLVTFEVTDTFGNPIEGAEVTFSLSSQSAGATASLASQNAKTNAAGQVSTTVNAGTTHGVLSVIATTVVTPDVAKPSETYIKSSSSLPVSVSTGVALQSSFSLSADQFNLNSYYVDGVIVRVTARLADRFGNPVPEGTIVNFTAESGSIPSFCLTEADGSCQVDWKSQGARPGEFHGDFAGTKNSEFLPVAPITDPVTFAMEAGVKGYTTITAYAIGEAGYIEKNSNGIYDVGEKFQAFPEVFRNDNGNFSAAGPTHDDEEEFFEFLQDGVYSSAPAVYQGSLCSEEASNTGHCLSNIYVTESIRIVQSDGNNPYFVRLFKKTGATFTQLVTGITGDTFDVSDDGLLYILLTDSNGNIPPAGTVLEVFSLGYGDLEDKVVSSSEDQYIDEKGFPINRGFLESYDLNTNAISTPQVMTIELLLGTDKVLLNITP